MARGSQGRPEDWRASYFVSDLYLRIESVRAGDEQGCGCTDTANDSPAHYSGCIPAFWMASCHKRPLGTKKALHLIEGTTAVEDSIPAQELANLRKSEDVVQVLVHPRQRFVRRAGGGQQRKPSHRGKARHRFRDGRNRLETGETIPRSHSDDAQPIASNVAGHRGHAIDVELCPPRDRVLRRKRAALIGDIDDVDAGSELQHLAGDVLQISGSGGGERELPRIRLREGNQFRHRVHRQRRIHRDHERADTDVDDGDEVALDVEWQRLERIWIHGERRGDREEVIVAVRRSSCGRLSGDIASSAGTTVTHDLKTPLGAEAVAQYAADDVGR